MDLKEAASLHINKSLTLENVLPEIFSVFSSKHDEIYKVELEFVKERWASVLPFFLSFASINELMKTQIRASPNFRRLVEDLILLRGQEPHISKTLLDIIEATSS
jgi:hypothetical protein